MQRVGRVRCMKQRWKVLLVTSVAVFMAFLDVTIVNVAFPDIEASFPGTSLAGLSWVLNAYNIVFAALLVPAGRLADRSGGGGCSSSASRPSSPRRPRAGWRRRSRSWSARASCRRPARRCSCRPRSALLLPEFPLERRATATALWGATGGVAAATGPSLGGLLIEGTGWRLGLLRQPRASAPPALVPARRLLRETPRPGPRPAARRAGHRAAGARRRPALAGRSSRRRTGAGASAPRHRRARRGRARARRASSWRSARHAAPGDRARRCSACARSRWPRRACSSSRSASTRCCWPTSCS